MVSRLPDFARRLLEGKNFAFLATIFPDGSPQVTPLWIDTDGNYVVVNTAIGRVKQRNVSRDARVTIAIADQTNPYKYVMIRGRVVEQITGPVADDHIDKLAKKYTGVDKFIQQPGVQRVILKIEAERIAGQA